MNQNTTLEGPNVTDHPSPDSPADAGAWESNTANDDALDSVRRRHIARVIHATSHNLAVAADILGVTISELDVMMGRFGIP